MVATFEGGDLILENYLEGSRIAVSASVLELLSWLEVGRPLDDLTEQIGIDRSVVQALISYGVILEVGTPMEQRDSNVAATWPWGQDSHYFHCGSRVKDYVSDVITQRAELAERAKTEPPTPPYRPGSSESLELPAEYRELPSLSAQLSRRRTCRRFCRDAISLEQMAQLLLWTWGQTAICTDRGAGRVILKTSPSGGARHPIEVYPVVFRVDGIAPGAYRYNVERHALDLVRIGDFEKETCSLMADQAWVGDSACAFFMTCYHKRSSWKYKASRTYRVAHLDAGHLAQTFHLVSTALGLGPFTTAATDDAGIERFLLLDPAEEFHMYACAVGWPAN
jgi:SagB-type dehydrogenase family enzyme